MKLRLQFIVLVTLAFLTSCSVSNDVVSGWGIQKRKYNDGYYISFGKKFKNHGETVKPEAGLPGDHNLATETHEQAAPDNESDPGFIKQPEEQALTVPQPLPGGPTGTKPENVRPEPGPDVAEPADFTRTPRTKNDNVKKNGRIYKHSTILTTVSSAAQATNDTVLLILLVILCFILPPVSVAVVDGISTRFWIDLILFLIGIGVGWWLFGGGLAYICLLVSVIYALLIVLAVI